MKILIKFLIWSLKSIDGKRNSALEYIDILNKQHITQFKKQTGYSLPQERIVEV